MMDSRNGKFYGDWTEKPLWRILRKLLALAFGILLFFGAYKALVWLWSKGPALFIIGIVLFIILLNAFKNAFLLAIQGDDDVGGICGGPMP